MTQQRTRIATGRWRHRAVSPKWRRSNGCWTACAASSRSSAKAEPPSDLEQRVGAAEDFGHDELRDVVDRDASAGAAFIGAAVGVAVHDQLHIVEAVDGVGQAG